ncbi:hypothetical protein [Methylomagnum sp.]
MFRHSPQAYPRPPLLTALTAVLALALLPAGAAQAAKSKVAISQAAWFPKTQQLIVKGTNKATVQTAELCDVNGRRLAAAPCAVRVQAGADEAVLAVKGAPKACLQAPTCSITSPHPAPP